MLKEKSDRNKTIVLEEGDYTKFSDRVLLPVTYTTLLHESEYTDRTICGWVKDIMKVLPEAFADLIILDPPYNLTKTFNEFSFNKANDETYLEYLRSWFPLVIKALKPNGTVYLCGDWKCSVPMYAIMKEYLTVMSRITWQRDKGRGAKANWKNSMEDIWFGVNNANDYYFNLDAVKIKRKVIAPYKEDDKPKDWEETSDGKYRLTHPSNLWDDITVPYWSMAENTDHPTQKPEKLIAKLVLASCPVGGMVFDPFLGSGTSSVVAKKLGRHYCGIETDMNYCCLAEKRLDMACKSVVIQGYNDGVFYERNSNPK